MQDPTLYAGMPPGGHPFAPAPAPMPVHPTAQVAGNLRSRVAFFVLIVLIVALIAVGLSTMQWAAQHTFTLGFPKPTVLITTTYSNPVKITDTVQFSASGYGRDLTYSWDFGDGSGAAGQSVSHTFQNNGSYTVTVTVTDAIDQSSRASTSVQVLPPPPTAYFTQYTYYGYYVSFDASGSSADSSTSISSYFWDFGDGSTDTTYGPSENHTFPSTGPYQVSLTVTDATNQQSSPYTVTVSPQY
jgi:PKD repeat protein